MPLDLTWIPRAAQRRVRWKNGAGWTTEIAAHPAGAFDWRLSVADVDADSDFSRFPDVDRTILALDGAGFTLFVADHPPVLLRPGGPPHAFSGDLPARCEVRGPGRDFNVMTRRGRFTHALARLDLASAHALALTPDALTALYLVDGAVTLADRDLAPGDCVLVRTDAPADLALTGAAALVRAELRPVRALVEP